MGIFILISVPGSSYKDFLFFEFCIMLGIPKHTKSVWVSFLKILYWV